MKKQLLMLVCLLMSVAGFAQYNLSGTVLTTASTPVTGQIVYAYIDTLRNPPGTPFWSDNATTNSSGGYSMTLPGTITTGIVINVVTADCTGSSMSNTPTYAGVNVVSNFTKCIPIPAGVSGRITLGTTGTGAIDAVVYLVGIDTMSTSPTLTLLDSTVTDTIGYYAMPFPTIPTGSRLLVKSALLSSSSVYSSYLPTYSVSSLVWSGATGYYQPSTGGLSVSIALQAGTNPGGPGFVGGSVLLGANKTTAVGDPLPNRQIMLTDNNDKAIAYTYSDATGKFSFPALQYGTYKIFGDVMGKTSTPLTFTISAANKTIGNVLFQERSKTFNAELTATSVANVAGFATVAVYPNPAKDMLTVSGITSGTNVKVFDIYGRQIFENTAKQTTQVINIAQFATGTYVLQLTDADGNKCNKWIVKE